MNDSVLSAPLSPSAGRDRFTFATSLFLRLLALVHLVAFASFWSQLDGLVGPNGLLPAARFFSAVHEQLGEPRGFLGDALAEIITRLHAEVVKAVASPEVRERFQSFGAEPVGSSPEEFATQIKNDIAKWAKVAKTANVRAD